MCGQVHIVSAVKLTLVIWWMCIYVYANSDKRGLLLTADLTDQWVKPVNRLIIYMPNSVALGICHNLFHLSA